jgi:DNA mismatch endonuclease (patch repair protein)
VADVFTKTKRSEIMARIKGRHTSPEIRLVMLLKRLGYKPQRHRKDLPGSPDVVLASTKTVLFVNGCFWHGHKNCKRATLPSSNKSFWMRKIEKNMQRDERQRRALRKMGWSVLTIWTCRPVSLVTLPSLLRRGGLRKNHSDRACRTAKVNI